MGATLHQSLRSRAGPSLLCVAALLPVSFGQAAATVEWDPWYVLAPLDQPGGVAKIAEPLLVEDELPRHARGKEGPDLARVYKGKNAVAVSWQLVGEDAYMGALPELGAINLAKFVPAGVPVNEASAYLYRRVRAKEATSVKLKYGFDDAARVWLNGKLVGQSTRTGAFEPLAERLTLELSAGDNYLLCKVTNAGGAWKFRMLADDTVALVGRAAAQQKVNRAIDRGCDYLISQQLRDGSWSFDDERFPGGQTGLCVYALLKSGVSPKHNAIQRGIAYLRARPTQHTYTAGCTLLALWALHDPEHFEWMADITDELLSWQRTGMWAYPDGEYDLSNTQYAVLGMLAAARSGVKIPVKAWRDVLSQTLRYQGRSGGFGYRMGDVGNPNGSMTAAGLTVVAIAKDQLSEGNTKSLPGVSVVDTALSEGARWVGEHLTISGSPPNDPTAGLEMRWGPYYLYGVERACTLLGLERLGGSDWYWEGASWLLDIQGDKGQFVTAYGEGEPNTCFALLFLGRATASFTGPGTAKRDKLYQTNDEKSLVWMRLAGDEQMSGWLGGFAKNIHDEYGWKVAQPRGLRISKVEYLIDGELATTVNGNAPRPWNEDKYAIRHTFKRSGSHQVSLRVHLMLEPATEGGDPGATTITSDEVEVFVNELADEYLMEQAAAGARNLVRKSETKAQASSQAGDAPASAACDARESSSWTCTPEDKAPWISLDFEKQLRSNRVALSGLGGRLDNRGEWDRATKLELRINKSDTPIVVTPDSNERRKTVIELPRTQLVRSLEVRIIERATGTKYPGRIGFAEIELYYQAAGKR